VWVLIVLIQGLICGGLCTFVGREKRRDAFSWFLVGFFLGIFGLIAVAGVPSLGKKDEGEGENENKDRVSVNGSQTGSRGKFNWGRRRF
jgi:hypothetical protein